MRRRREPRFEKIVLFFLLMISTGAGVGAYAEAGASSSVSADGQIIVQLMFGMLYLYFFALILTRRKEAFALVVQDKWNALLCLWAVASTVWSIDPTLTLRRALALAGTTLAGLYIGMRLEPREQLRYVRACLGIGALASLVVGLAGIGITGGHWGGVFWIKNTLGRMMALGALCFALQAIAQKRHRKLSLVMLLLCCGLLFLSGSATAIVVCVLLLGFIPFYGALLSRRSRRTFIFAATLCCAGALAGVIVVLGHVQGILGGLGRDQTLTGRLPLWGLVIGKIFARPIFGYGYSAFWTSSEGDRIRGVIGWDAPHAHNGFLETTLGIGLIGSIVLIIGMLKNLKLAIGAVREGRGIEESWPLFFLIFTVLYNLTESSMLGVNSILWMLYVANSYWLTLDRLRSALVDREVLEGDGYATVTLSEYNTVGT
jgi:exopolysaccharide production protein ExoQ